MPRFHVSFSLVVLTITACEVSPARGVDPDIVCGEGTVLVGNACVPDDDTDGPSDGDSSSEDSTGTPAETGTDADASTSGDDPDGGTSTAGAEVPPFDLATAIVFNSPADVATWAETATITTLDLNLEGVYIDFTKRDGEGSWPDVPFGAPGDSLEYTLWIGLYIDGAWYTSGCIQYWRGLDRNGGPPSQYAMNWYYDANRWMTMTGYQPAVGETVAFFVTAGDARNVTDHSGSIVFERSNVVMVPFPADPGGVFEF